MRNQELRGYPIPPQLDNTETLLLRVKELISNESLTKSQQSRYHRVDSEWKGNSPGVEGGGGGEGSRSILEGRRNGREKSRYCQFRYHAFISAPT